MRYLATFYFLAFCAISTPQTRAQGGPPMLTDDPGTPGNGHLENNFAATVEAGEHEQLWQLPMIDLNYGVGDHIQLNFETSLNVLKRDDHGPIGGPGSASVAREVAVCRPGEFRRRNVDLSPYRMESGAFLGPTRSR